MSKLTQVGSLVVWRFKGWNVGTATADGNIDDVLVMDLATKAAAVQLAEAHEAGRIDLTAHAHFDHDARKAGSRVWGGYAAVFSHRSYCSCGWNQETESKVDGRREREEHLLDLVG